MNKYKKHPYTRLQSRLTWLVMTAVLVTFFLVLCAVLYTTYHNTQKQEISNQRHQLDKAAAQILTLQTTVSNLVKQVIYDDVIQETLIQEEQSTGTYLYARRNAQSRLTSYSHIMDIIQEIMIYTSDGKTFSSKNIKDPFRPETNGWYNSFVNSGRQVGFSEVHSSEPNQNGYIVDVISYISGYYSVEKAGQRIGTIVVSLDFGQLSDMVRLETPLLNGYCLFNGNGTPIIPSGDFRLTRDELNTDEELSPADVIWRNHGNVYLATDELDDNWLLVSEISGSQLMHQAAVVCLYPVLAFLSGLIVLFVTLRLLIRQIVKPINQLSEAAAQVGKGNLTVQTDIHTNNEIQMLSEVFNDMVVNIRSLMHESVEHEKLVRKMQIENLMLQINPHFIYNTLNSIVYMARMNGNRKIADFTNAFISLLQSTLHVRSSVYSTVRDELDSVENYLKLQEFRYEHKFTYRIECAEELLNCQILNVMLQPMVENAIFHGIAPKEERGLLEILISRKGDTLCICVRDDGVGMTAQNAAEQLSGIHSKKDGIRKIGMGNVRDRIREIYGPPYDLSIESEPEKGTTILMTVPFQPLLQD